MLGLTDRAIPGILAREDLDGYARHVLAEEPRFVLLNDRQRPADVALHPLHDAIYRRMHASGRYDRVERFALNDWKGLLVFERRR
jgi:hypothetical protein